MRVLFDTNVVLDVLLDRAPFAEQAAQLMSLAELRVISGIITATTVTTIHYLVAKVNGPDAAQGSIHELLTIFAVAPIDGNVLQRALDLEFDDFEDAVQHEAAVVAGAQVIVTRNAPDFSLATVTVMSPNELLAAAPWSPKSDS